MELEAQGLSRLVSIILFDAMYLIFTLSFLCFIGFLSSFLCLFVFYQLATGVLNLLLADILRVIHAPILF